MPRSIFERAARSSRAELLICRSLFFSGERAGALLAVVVVAVVCGCSSTSPTTSGPGSTTSVAPSASTTSSPAPTAPAPASPAGTPDRTGSVGGSSGGRGVEHCAVAQLRYRVIGSNGAAGTILTAVRVTNTGPGACWIYGYPGLQILSSSGRTVPTTTVRGGEGLPRSLAGSPRRIALSSGDWAWFAVAYHGTPAPPCTSQPVAGTELAVIAPDTTQPKTVKLDTFAACGRLGVSAVLAASAWQPDQWAQP